MANFKRDYVAMNVPKKISSANNSPFEYGCLLKCTFLSEILVVDQKGVK